ncbi:MAG: hypothetical protein LBL65_04635 [Campylobacteraceae bacterium]|nr:hypothetical protein [Campylobacteraceae bacterium]
MSEELDVIVIPKGTVIHFKAMPFQLKEDTVVLGRKENYQLATNQSPSCGVNPTHVTGEVVPSKMSSESLESKKGISISLTCWQS